MSLPPFRKERDQRQDHHQHHGAKKPQPSGQGHGCELIHRKGLNVYKDKTPPFQVELVIGPGNMDEVLLAIDTPFFITRSGIEHSSMGQHSTPLFRDIEDVPMAFLTLAVFKEGVAFNRFFSRS